MLSTALILSHDALASQWNGRPTDTPPALPVDNSYLERLRAASRSLLLVTRLTSRLAVDGTDGLASVMLHGHEIARIERPDDPGYFETQLEWVRAYADLRTDRLPEIYEQVDTLLPFFGALTHLDTGRRKYTLMLLDAARQLAIHVESPVKFYCRQARPSDYAMEVQPVVQTPDHSAFPSGHSTEAYAIATVLHRLSRGAGPMAGIAAGAQPFLVAHRIATNRTVAGVHFPADSHAGAFLGCQVGEALHRICTGGHLTPRVWDELPAASDFEPHRPPEGTRPAGAEDVEVRSDSISHSIWNRAVNEWIRRDG
jgi:hypothetical protein